MKIAVVAVIVTLVVVITNVENSQANHAPERVAAPDADLSMRRQEFFI